MSDILAICKRFFLSYLSCAQGADSSSDSGSMLVSVLRKQSADEFIKRIMHRSDFDTTLLGNVIFPGKYVLVWSYKSIFLEPLDDALQKLQDAINEIEEFKIND